jgi:hypothetical protein
MITNGEKLLTRRDLRRRGWTPAVVEKFLQAPDEIRNNPHIWSGPQMRLYRAGRVQKLEVTQEVKQAIEAAERRIAAAAKACTTKKAKLIDSLDHVPAPELPKLTRAEIVRMVIERGAVDLLAESLEEYRREMVTRCNRVVIADRNRAVKAKILDVIAAEHGWLAKECARQKEQLYKNG